MKIDCCMGPETKKVSIVNSTREGSNVQAVKATKNIGSSKQYISAISFFGWAHLFDDRKVDHFRLIRDVELLHNDRNFPRVGSRWVGVECNGF